MQMQEAKQVVQVIGTLNANNLLREGWTLLTVLSANTPKGDSSAMYVLGKDEPVEKDVSNMTIQELQDIAKIDG